MRQAHITFSTIISKIKVQLIIIAIILLLKFFEYLGIIPPISRIIPYLTKAFKEHGYFLVAIVSFLENIVGFNAYFPGSIVILTTMTLTSGHPLKAMITFIFIYIPSVFAHFLNFQIGNKLVNSQLISNKKLWILFFSTMWHPNFAAITSLRAGSIGLSFNQFVGYYIPSSFLWNCFWGILMYKLGSIGDSGRYFPEIFLGYLVLWILLDILLLYRKKNRLQISTK